MATYYFNSGGTNSISDANNWYVTSNFDSPAYLVPDFSTDSVIIGDGNMSTVCEIDTNVTIGSGRTFTVLGYATVYVGTVAYASILSVASGGQLIIDSGAYFYVAGTGEITNNGSIYMAGTLDIQNSGFVTNNSSITNTGIFTIQSGSEFINSSTGSLNTQPGASFTIQPGTTISLSAGGSILNNGIFTNNTTLVATSGVTFINYSTGSVINGPASVFVINNSFQNQGTFNNGGSAINLNQFNNTGVYINTTTTTNNGIFSTSDAGFFSIKSSGTFTNNNQFILGTSYNTYFKGRIFPQIPSSAAFGTAVLF
jgi:hypothetical protein